MLKLLLLSLLFVLQSCVFTNPLYTDSDLVDSPWLAGHWDDVKYRNIYKDSTNKDGYKEHYGFIITDAGNKTYPVVQYHERGTAYCTLRPFMLDRQLYFDFVKQYRDSIGRILTDTIAGHALLKCFRIPDSGIELWTLNYNYIEKMVTEGKLNLKYTGTNSIDFTITATTPELQDFLRSIKNNPEYWEPQQLTFFKRK
jgi:hypothetical protein